MTICIGAICDKSKAIVVASDRMVTARYPPIEFEHDIPKIWELSQSCAILTAGDALAHVELIKRTKEHIKENTIISEIAQAVKELYSEERLKLIEDSYLRNRGLTWQGYREMGAKILPEGLFMGLDREIARFNYGLELLIAGVDTTGAHIYGISHPGVLNCYDPLGYHAIGSGELHAVSTFIFNKYTQNTPINKAVYITYEAKKAAEVAPGVGQVTDLAIITINGIMKIGVEDLKKLEKIYTSKFKPRIKEIEKAISELPFEKGVEDVKEE